MMDGFDDLLATSTRDALEQNPFEDPFSKPRSSSPDPWASFSDAPQLQSSDPYSFQNSGSPTEPFATERRDEQPELGNVATDPLDSAAQTFEVDEQVDPQGRAGPISPITPGFKEYLPVAFDEIATIRPTVPGELEPSRPAYAAEVSSPASGPTRESPGLPAIRPEQSVISPLEQPSHTLGRTFPSLALGGEVPGGWQEPPSSWVNDKPARIASEPSEDDDDAPIGQLHKTEHEPVNTLLNWLCYFIFTEQ
jgi:sorting nexin-1/2